MKFVACFASDKR